MVPAFVVEMASLAPLAGGHPASRTDSVAFPARNTTRLSPALSRSADICRTVLGSMAEAFTGIQFSFDGDTYRIIFCAVSLLMLGTYLTCIGVGTFIYRTVRR